MLRKMLLAGALCVLSAGGWALVRAEAPPVQNRSTAPMAPMPAQSADDVPAYHTSAPKGALPATINPAEFPDALNRNVYKLASNPKLKRILYQQPCYCHCDHEVGHKSLLDCYVDRHASICAVCKAEAVYAYEQSKKGKSARQIRKGIMAGNWRTVDLMKYSGPAAPGSLRGEKTEPKR
ncbi:MAG TPA: CYCXC family (seleno)protein [Candidatus Acidoferrales bacterium]|nr:CYCXC family (seleno)protein [Candidatus Acidoferrales bacterium]